MPVTLFSSPGFSVSSRIVARTWYSPFIADWKPPTNAERRIGIGLIWAGISVTRTITITLIFSTKSNNYFFCSISIGWIYKSGSKEKNKKFHPLLWCCWKFHWLILRNSRRNQQTWPCYISWYLGGPLSQCARPSGLLPHAPDWNSITVRSDIRWTRLFHQSTPSILKSRYKRRYQYSSGSW